MDTWERESPPISDESPLAPNLGPELCARSSIQNSELTAAEPSHSFAKALSASEISEPHEKNVDRLKHRVSSTADAASAAISSEKISSFGSRTVVIFGMLSFAAGVGVGAILFSKSGWNLQSARPAFESMTKTNLVSAQTTPVAASAPDGNLSETANQLQSIGTELTSLRQDIKSLTGELAQIREAQQDLIAAQAQRPDSRKTNHRDNRGRRPTTSPSNN